MMLHPVWWQGIGNRLIVGVKKPGPLNIACGYSRGNQPVIAGPIGGDGLGLKLDLNAVLQVKPAFIIGALHDESGSAGFLKCQPALTRITLLLVPSSEKRMFS